MADHPFDHSHVAAAPKQETFVELDAVFEEKIERGIGSLVGIDLLIRGDRFVVRAARKARPGEELREMRGQRRRVHACHQAFALLGRQDQMLEEAFVAQAAEKLKLAKLLRLKSARRVEVLAKTIELLRSHRLENIDLLPKHALNGVDSPEYLPHAHEIVGIAGDGELVELVQELFEPEFVNLMDDDEEQLVVMGRLRERFLQSEQFLDFEIRAVG